MRTKALLLFTILALAVFAAGCGSKGASVADVNTPADAPTESTSEETSEPESQGKTVLPKVSGPTDEKPGITEASGDPPEKLIVKDIKKGTGKTAKAGKQVTVNYMGLNWSNNKEFDTSWGREPFAFALGKGAVIPGWDQGVEGMKVGGRRLLIIPPDLGYGAQGQGDIPANETLIFVVDLVKVG